MSTRYYNRWVGAFAAAGGHPGPATLRALAPRAAALAAAGVSTTLAGEVCAREYRAYRQAEDDAEAISYLKGELRRAGVAFIGDHR